MLAIRSHCRVRTQIEQELRAFVIVERDEWNQQESPWPKQLLAEHIDHLAELAATHPTECVECRSSTTAFSKALSRVAA
jgi:hypothetical protein